MTSSSSAPAASDSSMDVVLAPVDEAAVAQICEMGYSKALAEQALRETKSVEAALEWLVSHGDAADSAAAPSAKSIRCVETGKLFRTMADAMIYAERTGRSNFEETDVEVPPLTEEERLERIKKAKELIKQKVAQREVNEKKDELERERARRAGGQEMGKIREEQEILQRKRDAEAREREKQRFAAEARKLREQVARDKAERAMEKAQRLGSGDPKAAYDKAYAESIGASDPNEKSPEERADAALKVVETFKLGGKGLECARILRKLLQNVVSNPGEEKYRKANLTNETLKTKLVGVQGGVAVLRAAGFEDGTGGDKSLVLPPHADMSRVEMVLEKVKATETRLGGGGGA